MSPRRKNKGKQLKTVKTAAPLRKERVNKKKNINENGKIDKIQHWLNSLESLKKKNPDVVEYPDFEIPGSDEEDFEEVEELEIDVEELDKSLKPLLKQFTDDELKRSILFECEWNKCPFEANTEMEYFFHIYGHCQEINQNSSEFICLWDLCKFKTTNYHDFNRHVNYHAYHTKLKTYGTSFSTIITLPQCLISSKQRNCIPELPYDFVCNWNNCNKSFTPFQDYLDHVQYHVKSDYPYKKDFPDKKITYLCKQEVTCLWTGCGKTVKNMYVLKTHLKQHTKEKFVGCFNCGAIFVSRRSLVHHNLRQFVTSRDYQCRHCYKYFPSMKILRDHERNHVNFFKCTLCDMSCSSKVALSRHIRYKHINDRPFACDQCEHRAVTKRDLDSHKNVHRTENMFKCEEFLCNFSCRTMKTLRQHSREHCAQEQIYRCHVENCNNQYKRGNLLSKHLRKKHDFKHPSGHSRFIYKQDIDGFYRLQTKRIESIEVSKQFLSLPQIKDESSNNQAVDIKYEIKEISENILNSELKGVSVIMDQMKPPSKTPAKEQPPIKKITDFAVMKKYLKTKPVIIEIEEQDEKGKTVSKKTIKVDEYVSKLT